jgi:antitoxin component of MazEF toxin-antitoxin module
MKSSDKLKLSDELEVLLSKVTKDNLHPEVDFGKPEGKEITNNRADT